MKLLGFKIPKLGKKRKKYLMISFLLMLAFVFASPYMFGTESTKNIFEFGTVSYNTVTYGSIVPLEEGEVVNSVLSDIRIQFTWNTAKASAPTAGNFHVILWQGWFNQIEDRYAVVSGNTFTFDFGLMNCYAGTYDYYFTLYASTDYAFYEGDSGIVTISNPIQIVNPPSFAELPPDIPDAIIGYPETISWKFDYNAPCTSTIYKDDVQVATRTFAGSAFTQQDAYKFDPTEEGTFTFKIVIAPDNPLYSAISDSIVVTVATWEDYTTRDEIPDGVENVAISMDGTLSTFGNALHTEWLLKDALPPDVYGLPKTDTLYIKLAYVFAPTMSADILGETKIILTGADAIEHEYVFTKQMSVGWNIFGFDFDSWQDVTIDLNSIPAGEYKAELITMSHNIPHRILQFTLSVNTFPFGLLVTYSGYIVLISVAFVVMLKVMREAKGWWNFQGRYMR